jgi:hypothetical protein
MAQTNGCRTIYEGAFFAKKSVMLDVCPPFLFLATVGGSVNECARLRMKGVYSQWVTILLSSGTHYLVGASSLGSLAASSPQNLPAPKLYACLRAWWGIQKRLATFQTTEIQTEVVSRAVPAPRPVQTAYMAKVILSVVLRTWPEFHLFAPLSVG